MCFVSVCVCIFHRNFIWNWKFCFKKLFLTRFLSNLKKKSRASKCSIHNQSNLKLKAISIDFIESHRFSSILSSFLNFVNFMHFALFPQLVKLFNSHRLVNLIKFRQFLSKRRFPRFSLNSSIFFYFIIKETIKREFVFLFR